MKNLSLLFLLFTVKFLSAQNYGWYPVPGAPFSGRFEDINFINDSVAWIGQGDTIYKTTDGGNTWSMVYGGSTGAFDYIRSLDFVNDTLGFMGCLYPFGNNYFNVSKDGGASWSPVDSLLPGINTGICGIAHKDSMIVAVGSVNSPAYAVISKDYGQTWTYHDFSTWCEFLIDCFIIDSLNIIVTGSSTAATNEHGNILRTNDGGLTWQQVAVSNYASTYCWKIFMQANGIGLASNESFTAGLYFKTLDTGYTWQEYNLNGSSVTNIGGIASIDDTLMFTGDQHFAGMTYSTDGGTTWNDINMGYAIDRIYVFSNKTAIASGVTIYKYHPDSIFSNVPEIYRPKHIFELRSNDNIHYTLYTDLYQSTKLMAELFTMDGKYIMQPVNSYYSKGEHLIALPTSGLASGEYFIRIRTYEYLSGIIFTKN
ncbi:MAG TPA: hypothetical protein VJY62_06740 [Bacteroidia bacterium]|nr:hypothetical protein [Bacteroidia bacterium]